MVTSSIAVKSVTTLLLTIYIEKWGITYDCIQELCMFVYPGTNVVSLFPVSVLPRMLLTTVETLKILMLNHKMGNHI
jgi:hypothetical protein